MFTNFYPITSNFDDLFEDFSANLNKSVPNYPPYNIGTITKDEESYGLIEIGCVGLSEKDVKVYFDDENRLVVEGKYPETSVSTKYGHKGLSTKDFTRKFRLEKNYNVYGVQIENGLLRIFLKEEKPEIQEIPINTDKVKLIA